MKSVINIGDLAKPADTLLKKIAGAIGILFEPKRIVRKARAEAEAEKIKAIAAIEIKGIQDRALIRFVSEETRKQMNIEQVITRALPEITDEAAPDRVDDDWIVNFFDKVKLISDEDMQKIWSKILSGQANHPGSFSKRTINILSSFEKVDAQLFSNLCSFLFRIDGLTVIIDDNSCGGIYAKYGVTFDSLTHLESIGLVKYDGFAGFTKRELPEVVALQYNSRVMKIKFLEANNNKLHFGYVILTQAGQELARICEPITTDEILEFIIRKWIDQGLILFCDWPAVQQI